MFEIGIVGEFESAHSLSGDFGAAKRLHGHTYRVEVRAEAREIDSTGTFYDLGRLRSDLGSVLGSLHYRNLNDIEELAKVNTTAETMAQFIFEKMAKELRSSKVEGLKVTVWESSSSFASYYAPVK